jgi:hypothetical protein
LHWTLGYLYPLVLVATASLTFWYYLKRVHWL